MTLRADGWQIQFNQRFQIFSKSLNISAVTRRPVGWQRVVRDTSAMMAGEGDTNKAVWQFSQPLFADLIQLRKPVLLTWGTRDAGAPFNDYLQLEAIRRHNTYLHFAPVPGTEHNFFPLRADGSVNYDIFNWDKVAGYWAQWLHAQHR